MWSPAVTGGGPTQSFPLDERQLRYWIWPFGRTGFQSAALRRGSGLNDAAVASAEGQQTLLQDEAELLRLLYVGFTRARDKVVLVHRPGKYTWLQKLPGVDDLLCCDSEDGEYDIDGVDTTLVVRTLNADMVNSHRRPLPETERWIQAPSAPAPSQRCARFHSPSAVQSETSGEQFSIEPLQGRPTFPSGVGPDRYAALGNAVHSYLAALPSLVAASDAIKEKVAERCLTAHDAAGTLAPADLVETGTTFCAWVKSKWPGAQWHVEVPASSVRAAGGAWRGTIDLLLRLPNGHLVLIDHKSAPLQRKQCADKAAEYTGQLDTYTEMLGALGEVVDSAWIHFPLAAVVARMTSGK